MTFRTAERGFLIAGLVDDLHPAGGAPVRSDGVAHHAGNAMEATFTTHLTAPDGHAIDNPGRITGAYLGACDAK